MPRRTPPPCPTSSSSPRCAPRCSRSPTTSPSLEPIELVAGGRGYDLTALAVAARRPRILPGRHGHPTRRVRGARRHPRRVPARPPTIPCASSSSATRSSRSARSRSPTSARCPRLVERWNCCASRELLLDPDGAPARPRDGARVPEPRRACSRRSPRASRSTGMESLAPALLDGSCRSSHYLPEDAAIAVLSPERVASRAVSLAETNREFLSAAWTPPPRAPKRRSTSDAGGFLIDDAAARRRQRGRPARGGRSRASTRATPPRSSTPSSRLSGVRARPPAGDDDRYVRVAGDVRAELRGQRRRRARARAASCCADGWSCRGRRAGSGLVERAARRAGRTRDSRRAWSTTCPPSSDPGVAYLRAGTRRARLRGARG